MVAGLVREFGVDVDDVECRAPEERAANQDVIEGLRVSLEHVAVALGQRKGGVQVGQAGALEDADGLRELEVI